MREAIEFEGQVIQVQLTTQLDQHAELMQPSTAVRMALEPPLVVGKDLGEDLGKYGSQQLARNGLAKLVAQGSQGIGIAVFHPQVSEES